MKVRKVYKKLIAFLITPFLLSGCAERSKCDIPSRHVHKYINNSNKYKIVTYLDSENMTYGNYDWNEDLIEITKEDEQFYKVKGASFEGADNWDYLYSVMASKHDYLEFYYHYTTTSITTSVDGKGHSHTHINTRHHSGWSDDPDHRGVNGDTRLNHYRFYGYRIIYKDGQYIKEKSPLVDDIRDIINDYPYFDINCSEVVYKDYEFDTDVLPTLKVEDFNVFKGPDLSNKELNTSTK